MAEESENYVQAAYIKYRINGKLRQVFISETNVTRIVNGEIVQTRRMGSFDKGLDALLEEVKATMKESDGKYSIRIYCPKAVLGQETLFSQNPGGSSPSNSSSSTNPPTSDQPHQPVEEDDIPF